MRAGFLTACLVLVALVAASRSNAVELAVGDEAPAFELTGSDGNSYTLDAILASGKQGVVLAWFPKAFTPG